MQKKIVNFIATDPTDYDAPDKPSNVKSTSTSLTLSTSVNHTAQKNLCPVLSVEFQCKPGNGKSVDISVELNDGGYRAHFSDLLPLTMYSCFARIQGSNQVYSSLSEKASYVTKDSKEIFGPIFIRLYSAL